MKRSDLIAICRSPRLSHSRDKVSSSETSTHLKKTEVSEVPILRSIFPTENRDSINGGSFGPIRKIPKEERRNVLKECPESRKGSFLMSRSSREVSAHDPFFPGLFTSSRDLLIDHRHPCYVIFPRYLPIRCSFSTEDHTGRISAPRRP